MRWRVEGTGQFCTVCDEHDEFVVVGTDESVAHLIATAPDLLSLAKQYASECSNCDHGIDQGTLLDCEDCADIRTVIAKAEGRHIPDDLVSQEKNHGC